MNELKFI